jgi:hypothetical protein
MGGPVLLVAPRLVLEIVAAIDDDPVAAKMFSEQVRGDESAVDHPMATTITKHCRNKPFVSSWRDRRVFVA